jgi:hypothetical protein
MKFAKPGINIVLDGLGFPGIKPIIPVFSTPFKKSYKLLTKAKKSLMA